MIMKLRLEKCVIATVLKLLCNVLFIYFFQDDLKDKDHDNGPDQGTVNLATKDENNTSF